MVVFNARDEFDGICLRLLLGGKVSEMLDYDFE